MEAHRRGFLEALRVRAYSPATLKSYAAGLDRFLAFLLERGVDDLREVNRDIIRAYQAHLQSQVRAQAITLWTANAWLQPVRRCFAHLEATDAILLDPCAGLVLQKMPQRLPRTVLTRSEALAILAVPDTGTGKGIRDRAILELFYSTGMRREEMAALTVHDVDCRQGLVRVRRGKFAKDRVLPMGHSAGEYVREYQSKVRSQWTARHREERALWLGPVEPHKPLGGQSIANLVRQSAQAAGIERPITPHVWRHTCATHLVGNGANLVAVQRLLGHRSLATTQIYSRVAVPEVQRTHRQAHPRQRVVAPKRGGR
jgi:integrase/recombinase XerD